MDQRRRKNDREDDGGEGIGGTAGAGKSGSSVGAAADDSSSTSEHGTRRPAKKIRSTMASPCAPLVAKTPPEKVCREGTDIADNLPRIFSYLNLKEKVLCLSRVCKGWNQWKDKNTNLFRDLTDESGPDTWELCFILRYWLSQSAAAAVTGIRFCSPNDSDSDQPFCYLALDLLKESKKAVCSTLTDETALSDMEKIVLSGPDDWDLERYDAGMGANLRCLVLTHLSSRPDSIERLRIDPAGAGGRLNYPTKLLGRCGHLEVLKAPQPLVSDDGLVHSLRAIGPANSVAASLRELDLTMPMSSNVIDRREIGEIYYHDISRLGRFCPNLEILKLDVVRTSGVWDTDVVVLPHLRKFEINDMGMGSGNATRFFSWLFLAMPSIEEVRLGSGHPPEMPEIRSQVFQHSNLRKLHLEHIGLKNEALSGINPDQIESIVLKNCGNDARHVLESFLAPSSANASIMEEGDAICLVKRS